MKLKEMHHEDEAKRMLVAGRADHSHTDNSVSTAKYTLLTFLPIVSSHAAFGAQLMICV